jgi:hypothetical protein
MNVVKSLKEIGGHVSALRILMSLRSSRLGPLRGRIEGVRNFVDPEEDSYGEVLQAISFDTHGV